MLLLHSDVFLTTGQAVLQWPLTQLRAGPGLPHVTAAVLLHGDPDSPGTQRNAWGQGGGREGVVEMGRRGGKRGGGRGQGEADRRRAQCLPRISKSVPLERSHTTRHGRKWCAPSHTYTRLIYIHSSQ